KPLCEFVAQLPEYTRRVGVLSVHAVRVRQALLSAREPVTLLFRDLPQACDAGIFEPEEPAAPKRARQFVSTLRDALEDLRNTYPQLLDRVVRHVADALGEDHRHFNRGTLSTRAAKTSLGLREPRLRAFVQRLRDPGLSDAAWAEAIGSFVISKPPARWLSGDEANFQQEVADLAGRFHRVESIAFVGDGSSDMRSAIRLSLTRNDGQDLVRIVGQQPDDEQVMQLTEIIAEALPVERHMRLEVLTRLLWQELEEPEQVSGLKAADGSRLDS